MATADSTSALPGSSTLQTLSAEGSPVFGFTAGIWWLLYWRDILIHKLLLLVCPQNDISVTCPFRSKTAIQRKNCKGVKLIPLNWGDTN